MNKLTLIYSLALVAVMLLPLRLLSGQELPPDSTCSSDENDFCASDNVPPELSPCEVKMNALWDGLQTQMDQLMQDPLCSEFTNGPIEADVVNTLSINRADKKTAKIVLIKRKALKKLRRQANRCAKSNLIH